jgi:2,4-dienoyl-CoA reductase-like NADH-dependent reductase (Old Yellow Enzyme family)
MTQGTQKLVYIVENILYENHIRSGRRRIAREIVDAVTEWIGDDMSKKDWDLYHGFPSELEPIVRQLRSGFGFEPMKDENAQEVYRWLAEQGKDKISRFIKWATEPERVQYVGKYRRSPGLIKTEWKLAFIQGTPEILRNQDGSLNV